MWSGMRLTRTRDCSQEDFREPLATSVSGCEVPFPGIALAGAD